MASSNNPTTGMEDLYAKITLEDEEEDGIIFEETGDDGDIIDYRWCLVGRFLIDRSINLMAMKNTLASIWRPVKGVCIKDLGPSLFLFQFFHEMDVERVIKGGPWTFNQHLLLLSRLAVRINPTHVSLFLADFWVQIHDLPYGFMSEKVCKEVGNFIGKFVESDEKNFGGIWRNYMRIRVSIDVRKPLKRRMKIKKARGNW